MSTESKSDRRSLVARVERDYLNEKWNKEGGEYGNQSRTGSVWTVDSVENSLHITLDLEGAQKVRFRLLDDDNEVYYGGWLLDDSEATVQTAVLEWGKYDTGCTTIQVKYPDDTEWRTDIG